MSSQPGSRSAKTPEGRAVKTRAAKTGLLPAAAMTGAGDNDTSAQSQPPNGDHAMRAAGRDPAGGERPMELKANSRLMISRKRGSRKSSLRTQTTNQGGSLPFGLLPLKPGKIRRSKAACFKTETNEKGLGPDLSFFERN